MESILSIPQTEGKYISNTENKNQPDVKLLQNFSNHEQLKKSNRNPKDETNEEQNSKLNHIDIILNDVEMSSENEDLSFEAKMEDVDGLDSDSSQDSIDLCQGYLLKGHKVVEAPAIILCFWCKRICDDSKQDGFPLTNGDKHFCSEVCFNQCRRASFKKSKACDWCRETKTTVSYVEFTGANDQMQFCSDYCLNQYKMHIFCRETEVHLQLHPHLNNSKNTEESLITPELWLRDYLKSSNVNSNHSPSAENHNLFQEGIRSSGASTSNADVFRKNSISDEDNFETVKEKIKNDNLGLRNSKESLLKVGEKHIWTENEYRSHISPSNFNYNNSSDCDDSSPISVTDSSEPVNLTVQNKRSASTAFDNDLKSSHKNPDSEFESLQKKENNNKSPRARSSEKNSPLLGCIRIRQLEEQKLTPKPDNPTINGSLTETSPNLNLPGLEGFNPLIFGQPNFIPALNGNILPATALAQMPYQSQILPHLFFPPNDLPRLQAIPHFSIPPFQPPILQQQTIRVPGPSPVHFSSKPIEVPPVTVMIPCPIAVPIPIPIPIPFPVPQKDFEAVQEKMKLARNLDESNTNLAAKSNNPSPHSKTNSNIQREAVESISNGTIKTKINVQPTKNEITRKLLEKVTDLKKKLNSTSKDDKMKSAKNNPVPAVLQNNYSNAPINRKERRSILKYTSDVYEINGVFVPKGSWLKSAAPPVINNASDKKLQHDISGKIKNLSEHIKSLTDALADENTGKEITPEMSNQKKIEPENNIHNGREKLAPNKN